MYGVGGSWGWGGSCRVGWGGSCRGGVGWVGHVGVGGGVCHVGVGWVGHVEEFTFNFL